MKHLALGMIVLALASTADARPRPKGKQSVKTHMDRAAKAHKQGDYELALSELQAAYALDAQPKLLYAIAQVYAKLDNCTAAIDHYEQFLAAVKDRSKQAVARQAIDACKQRLAEHPDPPPPVEAAVEAPPVEQDPPAEQPPADEPPPDPIAAEPPAPAERPVEVAPAATVTARTTHSPWYRDVIGDALVIGGVAATVGSLVMYRGAQSDLDSAEAATTLDDYTGFRDSAERKQLFTLVLAGAGVTLVTAGVLRYALRDSRRERSGVAIVPTGSGGLITASSRWLRKTEFQCSSDGACGAAGQCETTGFCSFVDGACSSGRRYDSSAGPLSGQCTSGGSTGDDGGMVDTMMPPDDSGVDASSLGCPAGYVALSGAPGHFYKVLVAANDWAAQNTQCKLTTASAYLAIPDTIEELTAMDGLAGPGNYWVGISDTANENVWVNVLGMPQTFLPWQPPAPDDAGPGEDCVEALPATHTINDRRCNNTLPAICECAP